MESDHGRAPTHPRLGSLVLVRIPMLGLVNHLARRDRRSRIRGERPRRGRNDQRHRKNHPEDAFVYMLLKCYDSPPGCTAGDGRGNREEMCELAGSMPTPSCPP